MASSLKIFRGKRKDLKNIHPKDGYAYFCYDDGSFHIDYTDPESGLVIRKQLNAKEAEQISGYSIEELFLKTGGEIDGDVIIKGNLDVIGVTTIKNAETLQVKDNIIVTNADGAELTDLSGFAIKTDTTNAYGIMYDPVGDGVKIGLGSFSEDGDFAYIENEAQFLATRDDKIGNDHLVQWNDAEKKLIDAGKALTDIEQVIDGKVDKVDGKGLSTNDFTNEEKEKLSNKVVEKVVYANKIYCTDANGNPSTINYNTGPGYNPRVMATNGAGYTSVHDPDPDNPVHAGFLMNVRTAEKRYVRRSEIEGLVQGTTASKLDISLATNPLVLKISLQQWYNRINLGGLTFAANYFIDWGDGTVNTEISHMYSSSSGNYVISAFGVIGIKDNFSFIDDIVSNNSIKEIIIPGTVQRIGTSSDVYGESYALASCNELEKVVIHEGVKTITASAFAGDKKIKYLYLPDSIEEIDSHAFSGCSSLEEVSIGKNTRISNGFNHPDLGQQTAATFRYCTSLKKVIFRGTAMLKYANGNDIPYSDWFKGCTALKKIIVPHEVLDECKQKWTPVASLLDSEAYVSDLGDAGLTEEQVNEIVNAATENFETKETVDQKISTAVDGLASEEYVDEKLDNIDLSGLQGEIDEADKIAKRQEAELNGDVTIAHVDVTITNTTSITFRNLIGCTEIDWGDGTIDSYEDTVTEFIHDYGTSDKYIVKVYGCTGLGEAAFCSTPTVYDIEPVRKLKLSNKITMLDARALTGLQNCYELILGTGITSISPSCLQAVGSWTHAPLTRETKILISESVEVIDYYSFADIRHLKMLTIPASVKKFIGNVFLRCTSLEIVVMESAVPPTIESMLNHPNIFSMGCPKLRKILIKDATPEILEAYRTADGWSDYASLIEGYAYTSDLENLQSKTDETLFTTDKTIVGAINELSDSIFVLNGVANDTLSIANQKADSATTLAGYGITDAYTKIEVDAVHEVYSTEVGNLYTLANSINDAKADKATTLSGYGITDAYTKTEVDSRIDAKISELNVVTESQAYEIHKQESIIATVIITDDNKKFSFSEVPIIRVDWGDSEIEEGQDDFLYYEHDYKNNGTYKCHIYVDPNKELYLPQSFRSSQNLIEIELADNVATTLMETFSHCSNLTNVKLGNNTKYLDFDAFCNCLGLSSITIPNSVTAISELAFEGCTNLKIVFVNALTPPRIAENNGEYLLFPSNVEKIIVPYEALDDYKIASGWAHYASLIDTYAYTAENTVITTPSNLENGSKLSSLQQIGTMATGSSAFSQGLSTGAIGTASAAFGRGNVTLLTDGTIDTENSTGIAIGEASLVFGKWSKAVGDASIAGGGGSYAKGYGSVAIGNGSQALEDYSISLGSSNIAEKFADFAAGQRSSAIGGTSVALGHTVTASGYVSHATGADTVASGDYSHAQNRLTQALNHYSTAAGKHTKTSRDAQTVIGEYNTDNAEALFIVGNGADDTNRSNALEVLKDGRVKLYGNATEDNDIVNLSKVNELINEKVGDINTALTAILGV